MVLNRVRGASSVLLERVWEDGKADGDPDNFGVKMAYVNES